MIKKIEDWLKIAAAPIPDFPKFDDIKPVEFDRSKIVTPVDELKKLNEKFENYVANQIAYQKAYERYQKVERRRNLISAIIAGVISSIIANLFIFYWPAIVGFFRRIFQ